ncbi:unnamed protein product [Arabis nemorensis]|uniref:Uncharacterized protein n=1 Tax=Arabis nemorensis TaxID=586526 RepID=A0A565BLA1_9BRAS|nr:unnamed protein product [Arabis nemorensis]
MVAGSYPFRAQSVVDEVPAPYRRRVWSGSVDPLLSSGSGVSVSSPPVSLLVELGVGFVVRGLVDIETCFMFLL